MGVPGLFSYLRKYNKKDDRFSTIKSDLPNPDEPVHLYLDFNGAIYQVIKPEFKTKETLIIYVLEYLDKLVRLFNKLNTNLTEGNTIGVVNNEWNEMMPVFATNSITKLFIAIDGVPPRAKIEQQRARRFHSVCRKDKISKIEQRVGTNEDKSSTNWHLDNNMITPGTIFMDALRKAICTHIESNNMYRDIEVIFNDWSNPGEGEHKILQYLRVNPTPIGTKTVIYGLDGDLIMLAMASRINNVFLIREAHEYGQYSFEHEGFPYLYMDIDCLKNALVNESCKAMSTPFDKLSSDDIRRFIDDYIVLMMVLGNDFMPKVHWISIKQNGHAVILSTYFTVQNGILAADDKWLYNRATGSFNVEFIHTLFRLLGDQEDKLVIKLFEDRAKSKIHIRDGISERERQMQLMEFMPMQYLDIERDIRPWHPGWRSRFYTICHNMRGSESNISMICEAYWKTLCWNANYYLNDCSSWDWFYPYDYSPTLFDFAEYLSNLKKSQGSYTFGESKPIEPQTLLLMVLPEKSAGLLARNIEMGIRETPGLMATYFPKEYELNVAFHTRYHECSPCIPRINQRMVEAFVKKCKLSASEQERNIPVGVKRFIDCKLI